MALQGDTRISALPLAATLTGTELIPVVQAGSTVQSTTYAFLNSGIVLSNSTAAASAAAALISQTAAAVSSAAASNSAGAAVVSVNQAGAAASLATTNGAVQVALATTQAVSSAASAVTATTQASAASVSNTSANAFAAAANASNNSATNASTASNASANASITSAGNSATSATASQASAVASAISAAQAAASVAGAVASISAGSTGLTPSSATGGNVVLGGVLNIANGGSGSTTSTGSGTLVLANSPALVNPALGTPSALVGTNITGVPNAALNNSSITVNGSTVSLGGSVNVGVAFPLTIGTGLSGGSYNGSAAVTVANTGILSVAGTAPVIAATASGATTVSMTASAAGVDGYLKGVDWSTFNTKQPAGTYATGTGTANGTNTGDQTITLTGGVTGSGTGSFATTVVTNANLTGGVTSVGNAATVITNANLTGGVTSSGNAATVITNANLTGVITSSGNATSIGAQTGTGSTFVVQTSPSLVTPALGAATATSVAMTTGQVNTTPSGSTDIANKAYVDNAISGLSVKNSVQEATTAALPTNVYNNGASGVGATLTGAVTGVLTVDGITVQLNDRLIVKNEASPANNGLYVCTTAGAVGIAYILTRSTDSNTGPEILGEFAFVETGTVNATTGWANNNQSAITVGTTSITYAQFTGGAAYTAGVGLTLTGTQFFVTSTTVTAASYGTAAAVPTYTVNARGQLTAAANVTISIPSSAINTTIPVSLGGTGAVTLTGVVYGNGTSAFTAATGSQVVAVIGSTPVSVSTNIAGGAAGSIHYQSAANTTVTLPIGSNGQFLGISSGLPAWTPAPGASGATNALIAINFGAFYF